VTAKAQMRWHGQRVNAAVKSDMRRKLRTAGGEARKTVRQKVSTRSARSSPGNPPARRSGRLMRSIRFRTSGRGQRLFLQIFAGAFYAHLLERGTSKMRARPFFNETLTDFAKSRLQQILRGR
jgi:HK97 gp10 family phage protein